MAYLQGVQEKLPELRDLCAKYHVRELAIFGSALRADFGGDSDLDFLVEFQPNSPIGLFELAGMQLDLQELFGRRVDLIPKKGLKSTMRDKVLSEAQLLYAG